MSVRKQVAVPVDMLALPDPDFGRAVRTLMEEEVAATKAKIQAGHDENRRRMGHSVMIDGVTYASREQARRALGISHKTFAKRYPGKPWPA